VAIELRLPPRAPGAAVHASDPVNPLSRDDEVDGGRLLSHYETPIANRLQRHDEPLFRVKAIQTTRQQLWHSLHMNSLR